MCKRDFPLRLLRVAMVAIALLCARAVTPVLSQQAQEPMRVLPASAPNTAIPGPSASPLYQSFETDLNRNSTLETSALASEGRKSQTIVISTLALVLGVIIIVLLATN